MIQQEARRSEQQPQHGAPQPHPAMHLAQPFDERRAARALRADDLFGIVEKACAVGAYGFVRGGLRVQGFQARSTRLSIEGMQNGKWENQACRRRSLNRYR